MTAPQPKAPINWIAVFALIFLPIVAAIAIPLYAYHHDFSLAAWISMFVLLGVSSLGITAGYHRLWAHRAYEATLPLKIILMIMGIKPGPKRIAVSTGKPDRRQRDNKKTPGNTPSLKPHNHKKGD